MITFDDPSKLPEASAHDAPESHMVEGYCPRCNHAVDAVCPTCRTHVEPGGFMGDSPTVLNRSEFYRRLILLLRDARNSKFMIECYLIATGDAFADGVSMQDLARGWGVTKATVSKQCNFICKYLGLPPSRYMRAADTKENYRNANRRPRKF